MGGLVNALFILILVSSAPLTQSQLIDLSSYTQAIQSLSQSLNGTVLVMTDVAQDFDGITQTFKQFYNFSAETAPQIIELAHEGLNVSTEIATSAGEISASAAKLSDSAQEAVNLTQQYIPAFSDSIATAASGVKSVGNLADLITQNPARTFFVVVAAWTTSRVLSKVIYRNVLTPAWEGCRILTRQAHSALICVQPKIAKPEESRAVPTDNGADSGITPNLGATAPIQPNTNPVHEGP